MTALVALVLDCGFCPVMSQPPVDLDVVGPLGLRRTGRAQIPRAILQEEQHPLVKTGRGLFLAGETGHPLALNPGLAIRKGRAYQPRGPVGDRANDAPCFKPLGDPPHLPLDATVGAGARGRVRGYVLLRAPR